MGTLPVFFFAFLLPSSSFCDGLASLELVLKEARSKKRPVLLFFQPEHHHTEASVLGRIQETHAGKYLFDYGCDFAMFNDIYQDEALLLHIQKLIATAGAPKHGWPLFAFYSEDGVLLTVGFWGGIKQEGKGISGQPKTIEDAIYEHFRDSGLRPPLTPKELLEQNKSEATRKNKFLVVHFGSATARPSKAFNETVDKWMIQKGTSDHFLFLFIDIFAMEGGKELYYDWLKVVDKADLNRFPGIFLFSPEGEKVWFETGAAWESDTESSIIKFLKEWVEEKAK